MNKKEFIDAVSRKCPGYAKYMINHIVRAATEVVMETVGDGEEIRIPGFGKFWLQKMAPRTGRNAQTGEAVHIPARWMPRFKPGRRMIAAADDIYSYVAERDCR